MKRYYIPYSGKSPSLVEVNGHKLILLSEDSHVTSDELNLLGADRLKVVKVNESDDALKEFFLKLAQKNDAGVVVLPAEVSCDELLYSLETQLPWIH